FVVYFPAFVIVHYLLHCAFDFFLRNTATPPEPTLFPYTTLFRSGAGRGGEPRRPDAAAAGRHHRRPGHDAGPARPGPARPAGAADRKSTRLNSSHVSISYAVFCLKKKKKENTS